LRMKKIWKYIILFTSVLALSGCFTKGTLRKPVYNYLKDNFGINEEFNIISTDNNWFEGTDHQTVIEIKKPYHAFPYLLIARDSYDILEGSDDIYFEMFKGAYIKQHPEVIEVSNELIKKYNIDKKSPYEWDIEKQNYFYYINITIEEQQEDIEVSNELIKKYNIDKKSPYEWDIEKQNYFYYINITIEEQQEDKLIEDFKKNKKINTINIIPTLVRSEPRDNANNIGVINFIYYYNTYNNEHNVPKAMDLVKDFQKSKVLKQGIYNIAIQTYYSESKDNHEPGGDSNYDTHVLFSVDDKGNYNVIPTPKELF